MAERFDPDRMNSDDVDPNDPEMVDEWLSDPTVAALAEDLGRQFRSEPPAVQIAELRHQMTMTLAFRIELAETLDEENALADDVRHEVLAGLDRNILAISARLAELGDGSSAV